MKNIFKFITSVIIVCAFAAPAFAAGGSLTLSASSLSVAAGATFTVNVRATSGGAAANTIGADVAYPADLLRAVSVSGPSVITISITRGVVRAGLVSIQGGIQPAKVLNSSAVGTITFKALEEGTATLAIASSSGIYADDGQGTDLLASRGSIDIAISKAVPMPEPPPKTPEVNYNNQIPNSNQPPVITNVNASPIAEIPNSNNSTSLSLRGAGQIPTPPPAKAFPNVSSQQTEPGWWEQNNDLVAVSASAVLIILGIYFIIRSLLVFKRKKK